MLTAFKKIVGILKYIWLCVWYNIKCSISNRKSFIIQTLAMFLNNSIFILFWYIIFNNKGGSINGVDMKNVLYLWAIPTIGYGIAFFCFGGMDTICKDICEGNLDIYLTKPKSSLISQLTSRSILSAMGDIMFGIVCGVIATGFNPLKFICMMILSIISAGLTVSIVTSTRLLAFWLGDVTDMMHLYSNSLLITLMTYPEQIFPTIVKILMYTVIPAMYIAHIPIRLMLQVNLSQILVLLASVVVFVTLMFKLYEKGLKKYESGNAVTRR